MSARGWKWSVVPELLCFLWCVVEAFLFFVYGSIGYWIDASSAFFEAAAFFSLGLCARLNRRISRESIREDMIKHTKELVTEALKSYDEFRSPEE